MTTKQQRYLATDKGRATKSKYAKSDKGKDSAARGRRVFRQRHPEQRAAHQAVYRATKRGDLVRPVNCQHCDATDRLIEASHNDYTNQLDVEWLCRPCHRIKDRNTV